MSICENMSLAITFIDVQKEFYYIKSSAVIDALGAQGFDKTYTETLKKRI